VQRRFQWNPSRNGILLSTAATVNKLIDKADVETFEKEANVQTHTQRVLMLTIM
jgi:hypothetical protein